MAPDSTSNRWRHHAALAVVAAAIYAVSSISVTSTTLLDQLSLASAYTCLLLMAAALSIGPLLAWRSQLLPVSITLRRDIGIWAASAGLIHLVVATSLSMTPQYISMYVDVTTDAISGPLRATLFLWGSIFAFIVGIVLLLLLAVSNNAALRLLGVTWWKRCQRSAYLAFVLTVAHGLAFQILEARGALMMGLLLCILLLMFVFQLTGFLAVARQRR